MKKIIIYIISLFFVSAVAAEESIYSSQEKELMKNIANYCKRLPNKPMKQLSFYEKTSFTEASAWLDRDLSELRAAMTAPEKAAYIVWDIPFYKRLSDCKAVINRGIKQVSNLPSVKAEDYLSKAMFFCKAARNGKSYALSLRPSYNKFRKAALQEFSGFSENKELLDCDAEIAEKVAAELLIMDAKAKNKSLQGQSIAKQQEEERFRRQQARGQEQAAINALQQQRNIVAKSLGYKGYYPNIEDVVSSLNQGDFALDHLQEFLIFIDGYDEYFVQSIDNDNGYVLYNNGYETSEFIQFAAMKRKGVFYGPNAQLQAGYYNVVGTDIFVNQYQRQLELIVLEFIRE